MSFLPDEWYEKGIRYMYFGNGQKRGREDGGGPIGDMFNEYGFAVQCMTDLDTNDFVARLDEGANLWIRDRVRTATEKMKTWENFGYPEKQTQKLTDTLRARDAWFAMTDEARDQVIESLNVTTPEGRAYLFDSKNAGDNAGYHMYLRRAIQLAKASQQITAQGNLYDAWTKSGFGMWAHVVPDYGLKLIMKLHKELESQGLQIKPPSHLPHVIYKPVDGEALKNHHDQMTNAALIQNLEAHVREDGNTMQWVEKYGFQALAHIHGGDKSESGATFTYAPMSPRALLVILTYFKNNPSKAPEKWMEQKSGPYFLDLDKNINELNASLVSEKLSPIRKTVIAPCSAQGAFVAMWPVGFPHGSDKSKTHRITISTPIQIGKPDEGYLGAATMPRLASRLRHLSTIAHSTDTTAIERSYNAIKLDNKPYNDGGTHKHPEVAADLFLGDFGAAFLNSQPNPSRNFKPGPFRAIAPRPDTVEQFIEFYKLDNLQEQAQASTSTATQRPVKVPRERSPGDEPGPTDARFLAVRQPWAWALVNGVKDIENRNTPMLRKDDLPRWIFVSSSSKPAKEFGAYLADLNTRDGGRHANIIPTNVNEYANGAIVGAIHVVDIVDHSESVWYNPDTKAALVVDRSIAFERPVKDVIGNTAALRLPTKLYLPVFKELVYKEIIKFAEDIPISRSLELISTWEKTLDQFTGKMTSVSQIPRVLDAYMTAVQDEYGGFFDTLQLEENILKPLMFAS